MNNRHRSWLNPGAVHGSVEVVPFEVGPTWEQNEATPVCMDVRVYREYGNDEYWEAYIAKIYD